MLPPETLVLFNDASDPGASAVLADEVGRGGKLDGLWLNAEFAALGAPEEVTAGAFDAMMATNVRGPMLQLAQLSPPLKPGASVLLTPSSSIYEGPR